MRPALLVLCLVVLPPLAAAGGEDLLANGDFGKGLAGWEVRSASGTLSAEAVAGENDCLHFVKTGPFAADAVAAAVPKVPAGGRVTVSARVRGNGIGNAWIKFIVFDAQGAVVAEDCDVAHLTGTFDWKEVSRTFDLPATAVRAEFRLLVFAAGEGWLDDASVKPAAARPRAPLDEKTAKWLADKAIRVATLDFAAPLDDLRPLKAILRDVRIVQLGEQSHGDGATFRAKARLVRFLHEEMGFSVLAFESGLFECDRANALLAEGKWKEAMHASVFPIWRTEETRPLFEYLAARAAAGKPMRLAGFDVRGSGKGALEFVDRLVEFLAPAHAVPAADALALARLNSLLAESPYRPGEKERAEGLAALAKVRDALAANAEALRAARGEAECAFFARCLTNFALREEFEFANGATPEGWTAGNLRDHGMAENLKWLAESRHPKARIVVWAATMHEARSLDLVEIGGNPRFYDGCRNMGGEVAAAYKQAVYTVGFLAHHGPAGIFGPKFEVPDPRPDSLEDVFFRHGAPLLFVPLRGKSPFEEPRYASPLGYARDTKAPWPKVVDAFFYTEAMTPTQYIGD